MEHDRPKLAVHGLECLQEAVQEVRTEEVWVWLVGVAFRAFGLLGVGVGQRDGIGSFDSEPEAAGHTVGVPCYHVWIGESRTGGKQAPEPLVDFDRREVPGIIRQVVVRAIALVRVINEPLPGIVFPGAGADSQMTREFCRDVVL